MTLKGMFSIFTSSKGNHRSSAGSAPATPGRRTFSATMMDDNIAAAELVIAAWDLDAQSCAEFDSLFAHDRDEPRLFLRSVAELQQAMLFFASDPSSSHSLVRGQTLMQTAMRRLEKEFHHLLSSYRLDPGSLSLSLSSTSNETSLSSNSSDGAGEALSSSSAAAEDLRSVADAMVSAGYGRECVRIYRLLRKSAVDEALYRLLGSGKQLTPSQLQRLDWDTLNARIRTWLTASRAAVRHLFSGERLLCDHVFAASPHIREAVFADVTRDAAAALLSFPESVARARRSPEKLFRLLDLYDAISDIWADVESVFSFDSTAPVRAQAVTSLLKLAEAARATLADFESAIQKDARASGAAAGGGIHPLTRYVMNYLVFLADYEESLADIYADFPLDVPATLPDPFFDVAAGGGYPGSPGGGGGFSMRVAWLVLVLLCKMDGKAEEYKDVAVSYLFLANNVQYVVGKVRESRLGFLLGDEWAAGHEAKARHYVASYERVAWGRVAAAIPAAEVAAREAAVRMRAFSAALEDTCAAHAGWVVADPATREEVRSSVVSMIVPAYRGFYEAWREPLGGAGPVRFAPEDVTRRLVDLFSGSSEPGSRSDTVSWAGSASPSGLVWPSRSGSSGSKASVRSI